MKRVGVTIFFNSLFKWIVSIVCFFVALPTALVFAQEGGLGFLIFTIFCIGLSLSVWFIPGLKSKNIREKARIKAEEQAAQKQAQEYERNQLNLIGQAKELYAQKQYQQVIDLDIDFSFITDEGALMAIADSHLILGNQEEAEKLFDQALNKISYYYENDLRYDIANRYYHAENYRKAIYYLQDIDDTDYFKEKFKEEDYDVPQLLGDCFYELGDYEAAIIAYRRAPVGKQQLNSSLLFVINRLAKSYKAVGKKAMALKQYRRIYAWDASFLDVENQIKELEGK